MQNVLISPLGTGSYDIDTIRAELKKYLIDNGIIKDVNYLGSNISILVDILSYTVQAINIQLGLTSSQVMLATSSVTQNIIQLANQLGYSITRPISAKMSVRLTYPIPENRTISIPKWSK